MPSRRRQRRRSPPRCPRRAERMPDHGLGRADGELVGMLAEDGLDRRGLVAIVEDRRGAMRVDVSTSSGARSAFFSARLQRARQPRATWRRLGDVVRVRRRGVADDLGVDARATRPRMLLIFQQQDARALAHHEAVACRRRRGGSRSAGSSLWRESARMLSNEAAMPCGVMLALGATGEHRGGVAAPDHLDRLADRAGARRAGRDGGEVRAARADSHRDDAGGDRRS